MHQELLRTFQEARLRVVAARSATQQFAEKWAPSEKAGTSKNKRDVLFVREDIYRALANLSEPLAKSYAQVKTDLQDSSRLSWSGTAHEIREVLATMLRLMAPDALVTARSWYRQEPNTCGPTQKQRVRYILEQHGAGSKEREVVEQVTSLEDRIGSLVRATYSRASDAAHRSKNRKEVSRIVNYFEAFAHDLLNLD